VSDREYYGKEQEKEEEKTQEKQEEKTWEEKWRRDPLSVVVWAFILMWAGIALLAYNMGLLARFERLDPWGVVMVGAGLIVFLEVGVRLIVPAYRRPVGGTIILAFVLIGVGLGNVLGWEIVGPLVLIGVGLSILLRGFSRGR
jgi:hypothetical protein